MGFLATFFGIFGGLLVYTIIIITIICTIHIVKSERRN